MYVNRVDLSTGETLINLTGDSITPQTMMKGTTAHNSQGEPIEGEFDPDIFQTKEDENLNTDEKNVVTVINGLNTNVAKLLQWYDKENYVEMVASISPSATYEIGLTKDITFNWSFKIGKTDEIAKLSALKFRGNTITDLSKTSEEVKGISSTSSYYVEGTRADGNKETKGATAWIYFYNRYYFGCAPDPNISPSSTTKDTEYSNFIKGTNGFSGLKEDWGYISNHKAFTKTPNCPDDSYIWYAYPTRYGTSTFKMNGLPADFNVQVIEFTNSSGYKENYYLYSSIEPSLGSIEVQIS